MKTIKLMISLFGVIFLITACLASPGKTGLQTDIDDQNRWQTYTNDKYQFTVQFPSAWQVIEPPTPEFPTTTDQVWFVSETLPQPQTGSRADVVLIFTQDDPSRSWDSHYFDEYQSDILWLGDIQARRISGVNKESRFSEIVFLAKIGDYYLQALPNHGEASLAYFDQMVSSIRLTSTDSATPSPLVSDNRGNQEDITITFEGINFTYPGWLAWEASAQNIPAFVDPSGFIYNNIPAHVRFDFSYPYTTRLLFAEFQPGWAPWLAPQNLENPEVVPQIFIFPTTEYAEISSLAGERIETLKNLLATNALPTDVELSVLPTFNSAQDLRAQVYPLAFQGGRGLRFIARYAQGVTPVVNPSIFYTFQGLTEDGSLYVAAFFPLYVPTLPDQIQVEDWDAFNREYQDYMADITSSLENLNPGDFEPTLEIFDTLIRSMIISLTPQVTSTPTDTSSASDRLTPEPQCFVTDFSPIAFMPDGVRILVSAENGVQIFNLQTMKEEEFLDAPTRLIMPAVAVSPDGEVLAWALEDFSIQLVRISDKTLLHTLTGHTDIIGKLSFSPDGDRLVSASHDTWVRVWDMEGNLIHAFQPPGALGFPNEVLGIGISPNGTMLATIPFDGPVKLWDLKDYQLVRELGSTGGYDTSDISFSPDGQLVASDTATGLFLWKTSDGTELLGGNPGISSMAVAYSPDGRFLAYGEIGEKFDVVLSSPDGSQKISTLEGHPAPVGILFFSPDGSLLLSSDWVETRIWRVEDGQLIYVGKSSCP
jgi:WD40 repeat protein